MAGLSGSEREDTHIQSQPQTHKEQREEKEKSEECEEDVKKISECKW